MIKHQWKLDLKPIENIKTNLVTKVIKKSVTKNGKLILNAAKSNAKAVKKSGAMWKSLGAKTKTYRKMVVSNIVGPKSGYQVTLGLYVKGKRIGQTKLYKPSKIFHLIENGCRRFGGRHILATARQTSYQTFTSAVEADIKAGIEQLAPKR